MKDSHTSSSPGNALLGVLGALAGAITLLSELDCSLIRFMAIKACGLLVFLAGARLIGMTAKTDKTDTE